MGEVATLAEFETLPRRARLAWLRGRRAYERLWERVFREAALVLDQDGQIIGVRPAVEAAALADQAVSQARAEDLRLRSLNPLSSPVYSAAATEVRWEQLAPS